jgi:SAM-dependent methyltransferase
MRQSKNDRSYKTMDVSNTRELYEGLPFPQRNPAEEALRLIATPPDHLGKINHHCFSAREQFADNFRILIAGGGTGDAAIYLAEQLSQRGSGRVTYIDQSMASMAVAQKRAEARGIRNIDWHHGSLLNLNTANFGQFDYINCVGVIHHMDKPIDGLRAIASVLKDSGSLCLMLYGRYGRQDITDARDLFKTYLSVAESNSLLPHANKILASFSPRNSYMRGRDRQYVLEQLSSDLPNLADIFLNPVEFTYSAQQFAELVEDEAGLTINRFTSYDGNPAVTSLQYNPDLMISDHAVRSNLSKLNVRERWKFAEIIDGSMHLHCAYISRSKIQTADFKNNELIPYSMSVQHKQLLGILCKQENRRLDLRLSNGANFPLSISPVTQVFLERIDNERMLQEIFTDMQLTFDQAPILLRDLNLLAELEWICLRAKEVKPFLSIDDGRNMGAIYEETGVINYDHPVIHKI